MFWRGLGGLYFIISPAHCWLSTYPTARKSTVVRRPFSVTATTETYPETISEAISAIESIWKLPTTQSNSPGGCPRFTSKEPSITVLWGRETWDRYQSRKRHWLSIIGFPQSSILRGLLPVLAAYAIWACVVWQRKWTLTSNSVTYLTSPLALMLAFRVNSVSTRLHEGRKLWGALICSARIIASVLAVCGEAVSKETRARCCRLLVAFVWSAKARTQFDGDSADPIVAALLPQAEAERVNAAPVPPLALLSLLRKETISLQMPDAATRAVQDSLVELTRAFGGMERLMSTPLSPTYMRHMARGLFVWLTMLPFALITAGCTTLPELLLVFIPTAYIMLGIDQIGVQVEQPFDILPVRDLAMVVTRDVQTELLFGV
mmetsp:Transcript_29833/g.66919  ORF Transcript_29833/g.66919 Transcript_29833/m.66919 type:complete len:376 (-) Transcript_29833:576-1703(-)